MHIEYLYTEKGNKEVTIQMQSCSDNEGYIVISCLGYLETTKDYYYWVNYRGSAIAFDNTSNIRWYIAGILRGNAVMQVLPDRVWYWLQGDGV